MKLYNLVHDKTGYISPSLWKEALQQAKSITRTSFNSNDEYLQYKANTMAVWIINRNLNGDKGNEV